MVWRGCLWLTGVLAALAVVQAAHLEAVQTDMAPNTPLDLGVDGGINADIVDAEAMQRLVSMDHPDPRFVEKPAGKAPRTRPKNAIAAALGKSINQSLRKAVKKSNQRVHQIAKEAHIKQAQVRKLKRELRRAKRKNLSKKQAAKRAAHRKEIREHRAKRKAKRDAKVAARKKRRAARENARKSKAHERRMLSLYMKRDNKVQRLQNRHSRVQNQVIKAQGKTDKLTAAHQAATQKLIDLEVAIKKRRGTPASNKQRREELKKDRQLRRQYQRAARKLNRELQQARRALASLTRKAKFIGGQLQLARQQRGKIKLPPGAAKIVAELRAKRKVKRDALRKDRAARLAAIQARIAQQKKSAAKQEQQRRQWKLKQRIEKVRPHTFKDLIGSMPPMPVYTKLDAAPSVPVPLSSDKAINALLSKLYGAAPKAAAPAATTGTSSSQPTVQNFAGGAYSKQYKTVQHIGGEIIVTVHGETRVPMPL